MMHRYLLDEPPLVVLPSLAKIVGLNEAIILQQVHYWVVNAREAKRAGNFKEGRWWVYHTYPEWAQTFPFWSEPTIKRTFLSLEKRGLLIARCLSENTWDRCKWYSIDYEAYNGLVEEYMRSNCADALDQIDPMQGIKLPPSMGSNRSNGWEQSAPIDGIKKRPSKKGTDTTADTTADSSNARAGQPDPAAATTLSAAVALVEELVENELNRADAIRLATELPGECRRQLDYLPFVAEFKSGKGAYLRSAIEQGFGPPRGWSDAQKRQLAAARRAQLAERAQAEATQQQAREARIAELRARLMQDPEVWTQIRTEAEAKLPALLRGKPGHVAYQPSLEAQINDILAAMSQP